MIRRYSALAILLLCALLSGCFFDQPLTSVPSKDINTWLLGVWEYKDDKDQLYRAVVVPLTGSRYEIRLQTVGTPSKTVKRWDFEAWISKVGNSSFLTLQCQQSSGEVPVGAYVFAHYQVANQNAVLLRALQLDSPSSATSFELRKEVRSKLKTRTLMGAQGAVWSKVSEVYWDADSLAEQPFQPLRYPRQ